MQSKIGFWTVTSLVCSNLVGSAVFMLPTTLAPFGGLTVVAWLVTAIGAMFLAGIFAGLGAHSSVTGGPHVYVEQAFGKRAAFTVAWSYWIFSWVSNAAVVAATAGYLAVVLGPFTMGQLCFLEAAMIVLFAGVNCLGIAVAGRLEVVFTILKLLPLLLIPLCSLGSVQWENFIPLNLSDYTFGKALCVASFITVWGFIGLETGTVPCSEVQHPQKIIPRATIMGTALAALVYLLGAIALIGNIPQAELLQSQAPYATLSSQLFGGNWSMWIAWIAVICTMGTYNGWTLVVSRIAYGAAREGLFPKIFSIVSAQRVPWVSILLSSGLTWAITLFTLNQGVAEQFYAILDLSLAIILLIYLICIAAYVKLLIVQAKPQRRMRQIAIAIMAASFVSFMLCGASWQMLGLAGFLMLSGWLWRFTRLLLAAIAFLHLSGCLHKVLPPDGNVVQPVRATWLGNKVTAKKNAPVPPQLAIVSDGSLASTVVRKPTLRQPAIDKKALLIAAEEGDANAYVTLAKLHGEQFSANHEAIASEWWRMAAATGLPLAQYEMGRAYRDGRGVKKDMHKAIHWFTKSAKQGMVEAMLALADLYQGWYGMAANMELAKTWYRQAAASGSETAEYRLALLNLQQTSTSTVAAEDTAEGKQLLANLEQAARNGSSIAQLHLAELYLKGKLGYRDTDLAIEYYKMAIDDHVSEAAYALGMLYLLGAEDLPRQPKQAMVYLERAAEAGHALAQYQMGQAYHRGWFGKLDKQLAATFYTKAAAQKLVLAEARLGDLALGQKRSTTRYQDALYWYERAALAEHTYAQYMLSLLYQHGLGVKQDLEKSDYWWYDQAEQQDDADYAKLQIAEHFLRGDLLRFDLNEAKQWYGWAAKRGLAIAQNKLAELLERTGAYQEAVTWYEAAVSQGYPVAEYNLGRLYLNEHEAIPANLQLAARLFRQAAYKGYRPAQHQLGLMFLDGVGVAANDVRAYGWLALALDEQYETIASVMHNLVERMNPLVRNRAIQLVKRYKNRYTSEQSAANGQVQWEDHINE
jgi:APA family basic amino acid/polyamine antiporter